MTRANNIGYLHAHGCARCGTRFEDACTTPATDGLCTPCQGGKAWQVLIDGRAPRDCCQQNSGLVSKDEKKIYHLAGSRLWFICKTCARTHPFDPRSKR